MADQDRSEHSEYKEEQTLWDALTEIHQTKEINIGQLLSKWTKEEAQKLPSPGAREDFDELCKAGCNPLVLAAIAAVLRNSPRLEGIWDVIVGPPEKRQKVTRALENAAALLEDALGTFIAIENEDDRAQFAKMGRIPPLRLVSELRSYGKLIGMAKSLAVDTEAHSLAEVSKYVLSSYVERTTGRPHDRNVSGLIGAITDSPDYNEVAYRMWRNRNYDRLQKHFSQITEFAVAMSAVITRPA